MASPAARWFLLGAALVVIAWSCTFFNGTPTPGVPLTWDDVLERAQPAEDWRPPAAKVLAVTLAPEVEEEDQLVPAHAKVIRWLPHQIADVEGGLPWLVGWRTRPVEGRAWTVSWALRAVPAWSRDVPNWMPGRVVNGAWQSIPVKCALAISQRPLEEPVPIQGGLGGHLFVHLDTILVPTETKLHDGFFTADEFGQVAVDIVWPRGMAGQQFFAQLLVQDWRTPAGLVVSPAFELTVGHH